MVTGQDQDRTRSPTASRAARTAAPVPSPSRCSATSIPSGSPSATPSPGRTTAHDTLAHRPPARHRQPTRRVGLPADPMKNLRSIRTHPSALAGGHDEDRERRGHGVMRVPGARDEAYPQESPSGEWCNWQHETLWMSKKGFEPSLPSLVMSGCDANMCSCLEALGTTLRKRAWQSQPRARGPRRCVGSGCARPAAHTPRFGSTPASGELRPITSIRTPTFVARA